MTSANDSSLSEGASVVSGCHCMRWKWPLEAADCEHQLGVEEPCPTLPPAAGTASLSSTQIYCSLGSPKAEPVTKLGGNCTVEDLGNACKRYFKISSFHSITYSSYGRKSSIPRTYTILNSLCSLYSPLSQFYRGGS